MISVEQFLRFFWSQYLLIEDDFLLTTKYVTLEEDNENAYSNEYAKILLETGSEVDVVCKELCKLNDVKSNNIFDYGKTIKKVFSGYGDVTIDIKLTHTRLQPWISWSGEDLDSPEWWKAYNIIKHDRLGYDGKYNNWTLANQKNTLNALAGLIQLECVLYSFLKEHDDKKYGSTPLPGSKLFSSINGLYWNNDLLNGDYRYYIDKKGILVFESPLFYR